jgi:flagellar basal body rod protein FlgG
MDSAASALRYWERKQEVTANNLANVSTDGFKAQRVFARLLDGVRPAPDATSDLSTGTLRETGNDLDVANSGSGFFVVQAANGERYTRGGSFHIDPKHQLVDVNGNPLLGVKGTPITLTDGPISIDKTGQVSQNGQAIDRLRMEDAPKGAQLEHEGDTLWVPPATRTVIAPETRNVKQGYVEESNVNSLTGLVDMVAVQRAYASVQKAIVELDHANETVTTQLAKPL